MTGKRRPHVPQRHGYERKEKDGGPPRTWQSRRERKSHKRQDERRAPRPDFTANQPDSGYHLHQSGEKHKGGRPIKRTG